MPAIYDQLVVRIFPKSAVTIWQTLVNRLCRPLLCRTGMSTADSRRKQADNGLIVNLCEPDPCPHATSPTSPLTGELLETARSFFGVETQTQAVGTPCPDRRPGCLRGNCHTGGYEVLNGYGRLDADPWRLSAYLRTCMEQETSLEEAKRALVAAARHEDNHVLILTFPRPDSSGKGHVDFVASCPPLLSIKFLLRYAARLSPVFQRHLKEALAAVVSQNN
jgi:hypothetical protein